MESMTTVSLQDAQATLPELIHRLTPGDEIVITENDRPVARLVRVAAEPQQPRRLGTMRGTVLYMAPDFDAPLDDFREYME
jgi:antitoxin (DNA-binding transcriptional repressor) of toxin-antitoxin stability system